MIRTITKKQFEYFLYQYKRKGYIKAYHELEQDDNTFEYMYLLETKSAPDIIVYSSIDIETNKSRSYAADRIRFIKHTYSRTYGDNYTNIKQFNRTTNVFANMERFLDKYNRCNGYL